jgi:hypothetical protein
MWLKFIQYILQLHRAFFFHNLSTLKGRIELLA